jgi:hypothetical protein
LRVLQGGVGEVAHVHEHRHGDFVREIAWLDPDGTIETSVATTIAGLYACAFATTAQRDGRSEDDIERLTSVAADVSDYLSTGTNRHTQSMTSTTSTIRIVLHSRSAHWAVLATTAMCTLAAVTGRRAIEIDLSARFPPTKLVIVELCVILTATLLALLTRPRFWEWDRIAHGHRPTVKTHVTGLMNKTGATNRVKPGRTGQEPVTSRVIRSDPGRTRRCRSSVR